MCSRAVNEVNTYGGSDGADKFTLRDIIHDAREMFRVSERLQWKEQPRLDHPVAAVLHYLCSQFDSSVFVTVGVKDRTLLFALTRYS